jgi:hypothetical protein
LAIADYLSTAADSRRDKRQPPGGNDLFDLTHTTEINNKQGNHYRCDN